MNDILEKYGLPGVVIIGMAWFVMYLMKEHKNERKEWQKTNEKLQDDTNKNIKENTNILAGLKTLLEHRK
jgi:hypothetical protein